MKNINGEQPCSACERECSDEGTSRREFLRATGYLGLAAGLLGLPSTAAALPIGVVDGVQNGADRRYPIPAADGVNIDRASQLIVVRTGGHLFVFALSCPHENNPVKWVAKANRFQCTKHDSHYQVDGVHTSGRATRNLDRYVIHRDGDALVVDLHKWVQSDKDPAGWAAATIAV
jgi:nitrite reductase/ring-hydroxylating ferredoxin subunit